MEQKELLFFEWVAYDNCNLNCEYCVNKGEYSQKKKDTICYTPGIEIDIAKRIVELSSIGKNVIVNLTGGEPLLLDKINKVISILTNSGKIKVKLVTNFRLIHRIKTVINRLDKILVSLHIKYRSYQEIDKIINELNKYKSMVPILLSQVDYGLSTEDKRKLNYIKSKTHMHIRMQKFMPSWTKDTIENKKIGDNNYISTKGKYCTLGYFYFLIHSDGRFFPNLWCYDRSILKTRNFLGCVNDVRKLLIRKKMFRCPKSSCGCNYNTFNYNLYMKECIKLRIEQSKIMDRENDIISNKKLYNRAIQEFLNNYYSKTSKLIDPVSQLQQLEIYQSNSKRFRILLYDILYYLTKNKDL
jgi:organic radical activating enzyme